MIRGHPAMYLIVRRPFAWLFTIVLQALVLFMVVMMEGGAIGPAELVTAFGPSGGSPEAWTTLWRLCIAVPFLSAILPLAMAADALGSRHSWSIPHFRRRLLPGFATAALLPCLYVPAFVGSYGAWSQAPMMLVVGVASVACLLVILTSGHRVVRWAATLTLVLPFFGITPFGPWLDEHRLALIPIAMGAIALFSWRTSTDAIRGYVEALKGMNLFDVRDGLLGAPSWRTKLVATDTLAWVRAAHFEEFGAKRFGLLRDSSAVIAAFIVFHSVIGDPAAGMWMSVLMGSMIGINRAPVLRFGATYPLSRNRRATVAYLGVVSAHLAGLILALAIVALLSIVTERFQPDWPRLGRSMLFILTFVPLIIVPRLRANVRAPGRDTMLGMAIGLAGLLALAIVTKWVLGRLEDPVSIAAFVTVVVVAPQVYLWNRLRRFYTTGDLA